MLWNGKTTMPNELVGEPTYERAERVEDYADFLMAECLTLQGAEIVYKANDLEESLPRIMFEIANWTGSPESSAKQMRKLHNLLADEFQKIADRKVK